MTALQADLQHEKQCSSKPRYTVYTITVHLPSFPLETAILTVTQKCSKHTAFDLIDSKQT